MNRAIIAVVAFVVWSAIMVGVGHEWRDRSCDLAASQGQTEVAEAQTEAVVEARKEDHGTQAVVAAVEQERVEADAETEDNFRIITREVVRYVAANPDPAGCDLGPDGLRAWRAANAGRSGHAELEHPPGADEAGTEDPAAAGKR